MTNYTDRVDGIQIRDVQYLWHAPDNAPPSYDIVKWVQCEPHESWELKGTKLEKRIVTEYCYSVGMLEWDAREGFFSFRSIGLRWLEAKPSEAVVDMIIKFCEEQEKVLADQMGTME